MSWISTVFSHRLAGWLTLFFILNFIKSSHAAQGPVYYATFNLEDHCYPHPHTETGMGYNMGPIRLACDDSSRRAGTIRVTNYPTTSKDHNCNTTIVLDNTCKGSYGIYLNFKYLNLLPGDRMEVYEGDKETPLKVFYSGPQLDMGPPGFRSITQLYAEFAVNPTLKFVFHQKNNANSSDFIGSFVRFELDYNVVEAFSDTFAAMVPDSEACFSLQGWVLRKHYCDLANHARISCPTDYKHDRPASGRAYLYYYCYPNPATPRPFYPDFEPYTSRYTTSRPYSYSNSLESYQIAAIVCVSISLLIAIIRVTCYFCVRANRKTTVTSQQFSQPPGTNGYANFAGQPSPPPSESFMGAPPAYTTVFPQGGPPTDQPPKY